MASMSAKANFHVQKAVESPWPRLVEHAELG
jgi:hypothetical protein